MTRILFIHGYCDLIHPQVQRVCSLTRPCDVNSACVMCGGSQLHPKAERQFECPLVEAVALQDPSVHPTLSLQSGTRTQDWCPGCQIQFIISSI